MQIAKKISLNKAARILQMKVLLAIGVAILCLIFFGVFLMSINKPVAKAKTQNHNNLAGIVTEDAKSEFNGSESNAALQSEAREIDSLKKQILVMQKQMENLMKIPMLNSDTSIIKDLQTKIEILTTEIKNQKLSSQNLSASKIASQAPMDMNLISFSYDEGNKDIKTKINYVPPGTFAKAVLLSGADTNAGTNGQADTMPITMRITDDGILPNNTHSNLKDCFVTAAAYGDPSSERAQIRLQRLSCVREEGRILDIPVEGTISDMGGNDGLRGHVVMRNGKLLWNAGISGMLSGVGSAMQQSLTTQAISPLGTTSSVASGKVFQYGALGGANTAMSKIADYYIKLAELYHPIVQIHAGSHVDIMFLKGFYLDLDHGQSVVQSVNSTTLPKLSVQDGKPITDFSGNDAVKQQGLEL